LTYSDQIRHGQHVGEGVFIGGLPRPLS